ncbi:hypothetical protein SAMN05443245_4365 [Paraburkholderia fungorum]|uniref:Uncharacterized protein n=1 Tax=Paraburkholderia fungorum TaxID=134537 RepID=A0A1H1HWD0_9BURK|nr:hypothetical protein [Paraburkholderia fungorum]SDR29710.1 hypothetical protein SAMN05443245_4365 [Paraburkholderia fungorum]
MHTMQRWTLSWKHGEATIQSLDAMLAPVQVELGGGRSLSPLHDAPWGDDPTDSFFDPGRVAVPPAGHPLADRSGLRFLVEEPRTLRYRLSARIVIPSPRPAVFQSHRH